MEAKQLIKPGELKRFQDWLSQQRDIDGGLKELYRQYKQQDGLNGYF